MLEKGPLDYISEFWNIIDTSTGFFNYLLLISSIYLIETE
jgi:hypothetical protein